MSPCKEENLAILSQPLVHLPHLLLFKNQRMSFRWESPVLSLPGSCSGLWLRLLCPTHPPGHRLGGLKFNTESHSACPHQRRRPPPLLFLPFPSLSSISSSPMLGKTRHCQGHPEEPNPQVLIKGHRPSLGP